MSVQLCTQEKFFRLCDFEQTDSSQALTMEAR
jgi:hypothetical protein